MKLRNIIIVFLIVNIIGLSSCGLFKENKGLELEGNCYENLKDFSDYSENIEISELSKAYLSAINYEITEVNKDDMTVTMDVKIPMITNELLDIVHSVVNSNIDASYDYLKEEIQEELMDTLSSDILEIKTEKIKLPIQEVDGKYQIIFTDEWIELIYGSLKETYINVFSQIGGGFE